MSHDGRSFGLASDGRLPRMERSTTGTGLVFNGWMVFGIGGRGRLHTRAQRQAVLAAVRRVVSHGGREIDACRAIGVSRRTIARWRGAREDLRPKRAPIVGHRLRRHERERIGRILADRRFKGLSVRQIVPRLADSGIYIASEATFYRLLRAGRRSRSTERPRSSRAARHRATGPKQVWVWDVSRLRCRTREVRLYFVLDVWSRKIVGWAIHERESATHAAKLIERAWSTERCEGRGLVLHADNGAALGARSVLATLRRLGVATSFTRARAPNDNPMVESLFGSMKRRANYPRRPFSTRSAARAWVARFVRWYNEEHLHSAIQFVTPSDRHAGRDVAILARRRAVYRTAQRKRPRRWARGVRDWARVEEVILNPHGVTARKRRSGSKKK